MVNSPYLGSIACKVYFGNVFLTHYFKMLICPYASIKIKLKIFLLKYSMQFAYEIVINHYLNIKKSLRNHCFI